jgi:hypothetical protein
MYVDTAKTVLRGKTYYRHLLRDSYRENGKVKHNTIANLSRCSEEEIEAIKLALKYKGQLAEIGSVHTVEIKQGMRIGAVCFLRSIAERINLIEALGDCQQARLALWQIFARLIDRGSGLSEVRLARKHSACDLLGLQTFNEDQLHENLLWLSENQESIRRYLFSPGFDKNSSQFFLSDAVISIKDQPVSAMLSYLLKRETEKYWHPIEVSFDEGMNELSSIRTVEMTIANTTYRKVPTPTGLCKELLDAADVRLPLMIHIISRGINER